MKYFAYISVIDKEFLDLKKYFVAQYKKGSVAKISFNDNNYSEFVKDSGCCESEDDGNSFAFGEDGYFYKLFKTHTEKWRRYPTNMPKKALQTTFKAVKEVSGNRYFKKRMESKLGANTVSKPASGILGFKRFIYIYRNDLIPFRFKKSKDKNQPLIIYLGGAGTMGRDNFKPLFEFLFSARGYGFVLKDCNIFIPQYVRLANYNSEPKLRDAYAKNCIRIINYIIENYSVDKKRIYIYGTSFGGGEVWNFLFNSPNLFSAAVETMGEYYGSIKADEKAFESISSIPVWMAHSSDDNVVSIESDDKFYNALKNAGADVKYTRWDKYGHRMCTRFYRKEKWLYWLLSKSK